MTPASNVAAFPPSLELPPGVVTGRNLRQLYMHANEHGYAIPAFRCLSAKMCNTALQAAQRASSPVVIRICHASGASNASVIGPSFFPHNEEKSPTNSAASAAATASAIAGAISLAWHVHTMSKHYGVVVVLQSETHCHYQLATWFEGLVTANEEHFARYGEPLYSSHFLDMTNDVHDSKETIVVATKYLENLAPIQMWLEVKMMSENDHSPEMMGLAMESSAKECLEQAIASFSRASKNFTISVSLDSLPNHETEVSHWSRSSKTNPLLLTLDTSNEARSSTEEKLAKETLEKWPIIQVLMNGKRPPSQQLATGSLVLENGSRPGSLVLENATRPSFQQAGSDSVLLNGRRNSSLEVGADWVLENGRRRSSQQLVPSEDVASRRETLITVDVCVSLMEALKSNEKVLARVISQ